LKRKPASCLYFLELFGLKANLSAVAYGFDLKQVYPSISDANTAHPVNIFLVGLNQILMFLEPIFLL